MATWLPERPADLLGRRGLEGDFVAVVATAALLVTAPVAAAVVGGVVASVRRPSPVVVSGVQHFAAGVVVAAVAGEVLPDLKERGSVGLVAAGFATGVVVMLLLSRLEKPVARGEAARIPIGYLAVIGVDLLVDGLLVGAGAAVSTSTAVVITVALTLEVLFLGVAIALELRSSGQSPARSALITAALSLLVAVGALLGAIVLASAGNTALVLVLAFAAAALLWLVVEELLVEAHSQPQTPSLASVFFLGFLALYALEALQ